MKKITFLIPFILTTLYLQAYPGQKIYVAVLQTQGYVVGAANAPSGFYCYEGDSTWLHSGWKNARNFGIAIVSPEPKYIFLACGNGVMRSLDGGQSWQITTGWQITEVLDVAINPMQPDHVYIATAYGVWRTTDRGETWLVANEGLKPTFVQAIETDQTISDRVIVGGEGGLFESTDRALHWEKIGPEPAVIRDLYQCPGFPDHWIAGTEDRGVLISEDGGKSWRFASGKIAHQTIYAVAIDPSNPGRMAAGGFQTGVFISTDNGEKWNQLKTGLPVLNIHALAFDLEKPGRLWVGTLGAGVYYSDNMGETWIYAGLRGADIWDMILVKSK